jgi:multiple sugar transport system permease protein/raffinose/stachyose/melibiose transport system permease protein
MTETSLSHQAQRLRALEARPRRYDPNRVGKYFVLPAFLLYVAFFAYPFVSSVFLSFTAWDGVSAPVFNGLTNYLHLAGDLQMWGALKNNLIWVVLGTAIPIALGLLLSTILWTGARGNVFFRTVYFLPLVVSPVVVGVIWNWIYNPLFGLLNRGLKAIGLGMLAMGWLGNPNTALYAVLVTAIWGYIGFCVVVLYSAMQKVDTELIDAATLDGAGAYARFWHVILPQISPVLTMVIVYTVIGGFNVFDVVYIMTGGGPANASEVIATYTYQTAFQENEMGYGSALSLVMTVIALLAALITLRLRRRGEETA